MSPLDSFINLIKLFWAFAGVRQTRAAIVHEGSRLSNPFACYVANMDASELGGFVDDAALAGSEA